MRKPRPTVIRTRNLLFAFLLGATAAQAGGHNAPGQGPVAAGQGQKTVDLVIALDTSSSMNGLIDAARQKLWDAVILLGQAKPQPLLRVGVISYGNTSYDRSAGWVRKDADLTTDLDSVYAKLFALRTGGGDEYVARAVHRATTDMAWSKDGSALRIIFVAGNEPATQDPEIPVERAVSAAREAGILVNTIYCGSSSAAEASVWQKVAALGGGEYAAIDHNQSVAQPTTPMDAELARLGAELNKTYIAYGAGGQGRAANMAEQDKNAASASPSTAARRAEGKSSGVYRNDDWDLVDARKHKKPVAEADMPQDLKVLKPFEREALITKKAEERANVQRQIAEVSKRRQEYLKTEKPKKASQDFDDAFSGTIKKEATKSGLAF